MYDVGAKLVEKSKKGDVEAFEQLIEGYQKRVFGIAMRFCGNKKDACELACDIFVDVFKSMDTVEDEHSVATLINKVTVSMCLKNNIK